MDQALRRIAGAFPGQAFTVISCLAEGADRLVARRILDRCDELPEEEKGKNRDAVRELPTSLAWAGFQVQRR